MAFNLFKKDQLTVLAIRMKKGDRKAAAELYDELSGKVYGFFFTRTSRKEIAEDLSQDIFVRLVEKIDGFDEAKGKFPVWFWQMARNMLVDHYRTKKEITFSAFEEEEVEAMSITGTPNIDDRLHYQKVQTFLKGMSDEERGLFELRYVAEMPYNEIGKILGKSEGALRVAALRIKEKIKKELKHEL
jgi:RNA polymerase sigma-70 factor (ECF subfamily)